MLDRSINGLDQILSDIPRGSIILVTGFEGTLKSSFVFNMLSNYLSSSEEQGLYATLEQTTDSHLRNMKSLGIEKSPSLHIFDYSDLRAEWKEMEPEMIKATEEIIDYYKDKYGNLTLFALDSLNAVYELSIEHNLRKSMYYFFSKLREMNLTSFLIMERQSYTLSTSNPSLPERFLADGVIELGLIEGAEGTKRYIQVKKMRAARHSMEKHQIVIGKDGLSILGPIY